MGELRTVTSCSPQAPAHGVQCKLKTLSLDRPRAAFGRSKRLTLRSVCCARPSCAASDLNLLQTAAMTEAQLLERLAPVTATIKSLVNGGVVSARLSTASTHADVQDALEAGIQETLHAVVELSKVRCIPRTLAQPRLAQV